VAGYDREVTAWSRPTKWVTVAKKIGAPVQIKAVAGGGAAAA